MTTYTDKSYALYPISGGGRSFKVKNGVDDGAEHREVRGLVDTPHGLVCVYSWYWKGRSAHSYIVMIKEGRTYYRRFDKAFTRRGLVAKAKQFANELFGEPVLRK